MLSFEEALQRVIAAAPTLDVESVPLHLACGRVLAEAVHASGPLPAWDYSAMDGYALATGDLRGEGPWQLDVIGESRTGHPTPALRTGTTCRIFTGACLPSGADTVVPQEAVVTAAGRVTLEVLPGPGDHIRRAGEDLAQGQQALAAGDRLSPFHLGLLAALDRTQVRVYRQPRMAILCTGDELRTAGSPGGPGSIPESNAVALAALAHDAGARVESNEQVGDSDSAISDAVTRALETCDLLVTVGGVSVGEHDRVRVALEAAGVDIDFWKVAIKPGKPLVLGRRGMQVVLGLPGNPVSAQLTFCLFGSALLHAMQGRRRGTLRYDRLALAHPIVQKPGRRGFYRARFEQDQAIPLANQASGAWTSLAWSDGLVVVPEDSAGVAAGQPVQVLRFSELWS